MKKLLFAVSALAALSLLAPSTGFAATNHMSLFADTHGTMNEVAGAAPYSQMPVYLIVMDPYNDDPFNPDVDPGPVAFLGGVEFAIPAPTNAVILSYAWPVDVTDVGTGENHIVGFGAPVAVNDGIAVVATLTVLYSSATGDPAFFTLAPADPVSIEGYMACLDSGDEGKIIGLLPRYDSFDYHVFSINGSVATEPTTMDGVKALYR